MAMRSVTAFSSFLVLLIVSQTYSAPADTVNSLVVSSTEAATSSSEGKEGAAPKGDESEDRPKDLKIDQMFIHSNISNRYSNTTVTSKVKNYADGAKEAVFSIVLPKNAFIAGFIMEVDGKNYSAYVKEKEEAKKDYEQAVASGISAGHVAVSARDSNRFRVSINVEPQTKAAFYLWYEELLKRENGVYELIINLHPGQPVKDLNVEVDICETRKLTKLKTPPLRSGNEIGEETEELDPRADIQKIDDYSATVTFSPNVERQKQLASLLGTKQENGISGQFVVQYDTERDPTGGEVLVKDGYFVHFFSPSDLPPLPKQVVFVLDTSGSMWGRKIEQLRIAMLTILDELKPSDTFNIVEFSTDVFVWDVENAKASEGFSSNTWNTDLSKERQPENATFPREFPATPENIEKAKDIIRKMESTSSTNIYSALKVALHLVGVARESQKDSSSPQPLIMFLTDGEPANDITDTDIITSRISEYNSGKRISPIFALSFGTGADRKFLEKLSLSNYGFSRHIYEAADSALQLQNFYKQISSPLLSNVKFKYESNAEELTKTSFPILFEGTEIVVAGKTDSDSESFVPPQIMCWGMDGVVELTARSSKPASSVERLWGYLTIQQLLQQREVDKEHKEELTKKALDLALKYSFVTEVSSLVVVKPNVTDAVGTETAENGEQRPPYALSFAGIPGPPPGAPGFPGQLGISRPAGFALSGLSGPSYGLVDIRVTAEDELQSYNYTASTSVIPPPKLEDDLLSTLSWLKDIIDDNGVLSSPEGGYKLGTNATVNEKVSCSNAPTNITEGHCKLLHDCPQVHSALISVEVFLQHFCPLKEYAGICCPDSGEKKTD